MVINAPVIRPGFARTNSAASGLRFWGIIDDPVEKASESRINPKRSDDQNTISSAKRDRCVAVIAAAARYSMAKSRADTASIELAIGASNPNVLAVIWRSIGKEVPAKAAAPRGDSFIRFLASAKRPRSRPNI